jgi:hypothetical protein
LPRRREVSAVETRDLVTVAAMTWHQFRATRGEPLGFLCMVNAARDKPQLPSPEDLAKLERNARIAAFLRDEPQSVGVSRRCGFVGDRAC